MCKLYILKYLFISILFWILSKGYFFVMAKRPTSMYSKAETDSLFTNIAKLFFKNLYFVNDEVREGCPKLKGTLPYLPFLFCP